MYNSPNDISLNASVNSSNCIVKANTLLFSGNIINKTIIQIASYNMSFLYVVGRPDISSTSIPDNSTILIKHLPKQINKPSKLIVQAFFNVNMKPNSFGEDYFNIILYQKKLSFNPPPNNIELDRGYMHFGNSAGGGSRRQMRPLIGEIQLTANNPEIQIFLFSFSSNESDYISSGEKATFVFTQIQV